MKLTVGTRGSKLALAQTNRTLNQIKQKRPDVDFKLKVIKTIGDKEHGKPLFSIDCKGIFEKEIDQASRQRRNGFCGSQPKRCAHR